MVGQLVLVQRIGVRVPVQQQTARDVYLPSYGVFLATINPLLKRIIRFVIQ